MASLENRKSPRLPQLERIRTVDEAGQIAARFFSPREQRGLRALSGELRQSAFFNAWTRKEAYLKTIGRGLDDVLDQIEVSLSPGEAAELLSAPNSLPPCFFHTLVPAAEFVGALAVPRQNSRVNCWTWNGRP